MDLVVTAPRREVGDQVFGVVVGRGVILGSGGPGLLYLYKRVCRPPGGRGGAGEGYMGASDGALSPGGSIWLTSRPVLEVLVRGAGLYEI